MGDSQAAKPRGNPGVVDVRLASELAVAERIAVEYYLLRYQLETGVSTSFESPSGATQAAPIVYILLRPGSHAFGIQAASCCQAQA